MNIKPYLLCLWNFWPPFLFTGIRIIHKSKDYRQMKARLKLHFWNENYVGTQYGGSIFSLSDPFYMIMLLKNLGPGYTIWDKSATIQYLRPGRTDLTAEFFLTEQDLEVIRKTIQEQGKMDWQRKIEIKDKTGKVVAEVDKVISIKRKG